MPLYQEALGGGDRSATQSQMLFDIAQAGLNLAAGTDAQGKRVAPGARSLLVWPQPHKVCQSVLVRVSD